MGIKLLVPMYHRRVLLLNFFIMSHQIRHRRPIP